MAIPHRHADLVISMAMRNGHIGWYRITFGFFNNEIGAWYTSRHVINRYQCLVIFHTITTLVAVKINPTLWVDSKNIIIMANYYRRKHYCTIKF